MELEKAIEILEVWIIEDRRMRKDSFDDEDFFMQDFDFFCEEKNQAIETVLKAVKEK